MKALNWIQLKCDCEFTTSKWRDDRAGYNSAINELKDHIEQCHKHDAAIKKSFELFSTV
jgi:hypothetical protein